MLLGRTVFAELISYVSARKFKTCVDRYHADHKTSRFTCWDQFLCMAFAQLTYRESLRDIEACLRAMQPKLYHVGSRARVARPTLAEASETRDWRICADFAQGLNTTARALYVDEPLASNSRTPCMRSTRRSSSSVCRCFPGPGIGDTTARLRCTRRWTCAA